AARVVAQVLFEELGFSGDPGDPEGSSRERFDLDRVLIDRRGTCLAVTVVALAAAETAGMEVAPVLRPGHAMIAVPPGYLIDPATGGVRTPGTQDRIASPAELHADLLANRATYRRAQGDADGALQDVERALELAPSQATARANRAVLLLDLGRNEEAAADLELVEAAGQGSAQTAYNLGLASARLERMGVAKHWYGVATARDARYLKAWINLGALHETLGEPAAARQAYRAALGIDPDDAVARAGLERVGDAVPAD
ncbi:MAG: tetratricopeptide repeat protein, partial [Planctomycetota bacterium]